MNRKSERESVDRLYSEYNTTLRGGLLKGGKRIKVQLQTRRDDTKGEREERGDAILHFMVYIERGGE